MISHRLKVSLLLAIVGIFAHAVFDVVVDDEVEFLVGEAVMFGQGVSSIGLRGCFKSPVMSRKTV
jgi:hypothetical protein